MNTIRRYEAWAGDTSEGAVRVGIFDTREQAIAHLEQWHSDSEAYFVMGTITTTRYTLEHVKGQGL